MSVSNPDPETGEVNLFAPDVAAHPQQVYNDMHARCPVARQALTGGAVIARYEDVMWALRHPEIFSSEMEMQMALGTERPMIPQQVDPPEQTRYRKILDPRFTKKRLQSIEGGIREHAGELIDAFADAGECEFNSAFAVPLPCHAFLRLMGLPLTDLDHFLGLKDDIIRPHAKTQDVEEMGRLRVAAGKNIYAYFETVIDERQANPGEDMMGYFLRAEIDGDRLSRNEILDICFLFLLAGLDTVTATLGCSVAYLAANPEQRRKVVENPALLDAAVEELLRWETPVTGLPRVVKQDTAIGGVEIKKGEMVTLLLGAANLDAGEFPSPNQVDFERPSNRHIAFGAGAHRCLGSHLARLELRLALEELHRRIPDYGIKPGEIPRYSPGIREVQYLPLVWDVA